MRSRAIRTWMVALAGCVSMGTANPVGIAATSVNLTAFVGCSRSLPRIQAAMGETTISGVRAEMGDLGQGATLTVELPENITAFDPLPLFCTVFTFDTDTGAGERPRVR